MDGKKICKCGKVLSKGYNITRHIKSTKHRKYLEENKAEIDEALRKYEQYEHLAKACAGELENYISKYYDGNQHVG